MNAFARGAVRDLLLLSLTAGSADAAGFMGLGHVFTSNMTGNVVLFGVAVGQAHVSDAAHSLYVLAIFLTGAYLGAWLSHGIDEKDWPRIVVRLLGLEALLLTSFAIYWSLLAPRSREGFAYPLMTLLALAMGLQSAAMYRLNVPGVATTAVTGTLTSLVGTVVKVFKTPATLGPQVDSGRTKVLFQALVVALYGGGAMVSGLLMLFCSRAVGFFPMIAVLVVVLEHGANARTAENSSPSRD
jgi:uncharacterized membrane protein YoaK (UPF0700 family)